MKCLNMALGIIAVNIHEKWHYLAEESPRQLLEPFSPETAYHGLVLVE